MSNKSKVLALLICLTMLVGAMPLMAFADGTSPIDITDIDVVDGDGVVTVTVDYTTDASVGDQITILATTTGYDVEFDGDGAVTNIAYIDQFNKPDGAVKTFSFDVSKDFLGTATVLYVKMGGTDVLNPAASEGNIDKGGAVVILYGDVNGNGEVTAFDASLILQYLAFNLDEFPHPDGHEAGMIAADVSGEGEVTAFDASLILQYLAFNLDEFPVVENQQP